METIREILNIVTTAGLYPDCKTISGTATGTEITIDNKKIAIFCSNDYLGLANNPVLKQAAHAAIDSYGVGSGGSRLVSGNTDIQLSLEREIADFKKAEAAITFSTGYMANTGVIPAVMDAPLGLDRLSANPLKRMKKNNNVILSDELNHASIIDGCRLSHARIEVYRHKDMKDLKKQLIRYRSWRKLIVTDGVFSMDGDIAPLPDIVSLAKEYRAITMVDDAHASGVLGETGRGTAEFFGLRSGDLDIVMGTFTKAFGGVGGFITGRKELIDFLRIASRSYIFSAPIPPAICAALIAAIQEIKKDRQLLKRLWDNVAYLKSGLNKLGFDTLASETPIIPVFIGDEKAAIRFSSLLLGQGFLAPCVRWPAVPWKKARIRLTARATHTRSMIDGLLKAMEKPGKELKII